MSTPCDAYLRTRIGLSANVTGEYGLLVADVFNAYANSPASAKPPALNGSLLDKLQTEGQVLGYLVAQDAVIDVLGNMVIKPALACYGVLIRDFDGTYVIAVRGTANLREWLINAEVALVPYPGNTQCAVEQGFWSIYSSMQFIPTASVPAASAGQALGDVLAAQIGNNSVVVTGHSLGAAIATYLAFDLTPKLTKCQVTACLFASPYPGDQVFADAFDQALQDNEARYVVINNGADDVPRLPLQKNFSPLPGVLTLSAANIDLTMTVNNDLLCNHHVVCYAAMLSSASVDQYALDAGASATWASLLKVNGDQANCLMTAQQIAANNQEGLGGA